MKRPRSAAAAVVVFVAGLLACTTGAPVPSAPASVDLVVAATTDVHGRLTGWDYFAGRPDSASSLARAATIIDSVRVANPGRVILLDAGDLLQGNPLAYVAARVQTSGPHPVIAAMNVMRYDAAAIGNHEFNFGLAILDRAIGSATFPFLAANAYRPDGARAYPAFRIVERAGLRIGVIGATTPGSMVWDRDNLRDRIVLRDIVTEVRRAAGEARAKGADLLVVTVHSGLAGPSSYDTATTHVPPEDVAARIAHEVPGIALIVYGHSHREMADTVINGTMLMQPKNWAMSVAIAHLGVERAAGGWRVANHRGALVRTAGHREDSSVVRAVAPAHAATLAYVQRVIGTTAVAWRADSARVRDMPLTDFMLEVERRAANADLATTPAFSLEASIDSGPITVAEIARLYPYENTLRAVRVTGAQLREYLEFSARYFRTVTPGSTAPIVDQSIPGYNYDIVSGADYTIDLRNPFGSRITSLTVGGRPVAPTDTFTMALNNYRQTGGGGYAMLSGAPVVYDRQQEVRQLLIDEVARRGTLRPADYAQHNWRLLPDEAVAQAYREMQRGGRGGVAPVAGPPLARRTLRVISTNDFHGAFEPRPDSSGVRRGGAAYLARAIDDARKECAASTAGCVSVLVDGGDMFQGTLASNLTFGATVTDLYNRLGYAASALGNHEFDWTTDTLRARMREAHYEILGANVQFDDGRDVPWIPDDTLVTVGDLRIGIIGIADPETPANTMAERVKGLTFADPAPIIDRHARDLRARGASVVLVLAHMGAFCGRGPTPSCDGSIIGLAQRLTEHVDAIVSGHTHSRVVTRVNGIPIVQAYTRGSAIGVIDIPLGAPGDTATYGVRDVLTDRLAPLPAVDSLVQQAVGAVASRMNQPIAEVATRLVRAGEQYPLGNLIADAQRAAGHADAAVMNNGGIRADLAAGTATFASFYEIHPFGNQLVKLTVHGRDLRAYLERLVGGDAMPRYHVSGMRIVHAPVKPEGARIVSIDMSNGAPLDSMRTYTIVMSDFMATTVEGRALVATATRNEPLRISDLDALIAYVKAAPQPLRVRDEARFVAAMP